MPTVDIFPTHASFTEGWTGYNGSSNVEADVGFINDSKLTTYITSPEEPDTTPTFTISAFSNNSIYSGRVINSITLTTTGKALSIGSTLTQRLTTTYRGVAGTTIALSNTVVGGIINLSTTYTTLAHPLTSVAIADNHIDDIGLNLSVSEGQLLILDVFIRVDYVQVTAGRIEMNSGFVELMEGHLALQ